MACQSMSHHKVLRRLLFAVSTVTVLVKYGYLAKKPVDGVGTLSMISWSVCTIFVVR